MPKSLKLTILQNAKLKKRYFLENLSLGEKSEKSKKRRDELFAEGAYFNLR